MNLRTNSNAKFLPGATPLIIAAALGEDRMVQLLSDAGADQRTQNPNETVEDERCT